MKKFLFVIVSLLLITSTQAIAADGDMIVSGSLGIGTGTTPLQAKLDVNGSMSVLINGVRLNLTFVNLGEDVYGAQNQSYSTDSCDGNINNGYSCGPSEARSCTDVYMTGDGEYYYYVSRTVTCKLSAVFMQP